MKKVNFNLFGKEHEAELNCLDVYPDTNNLDLVEEDVNRVVGEYADALLSEVSKAFSYFKYENGNLYCDETGLEDWLVTMGYV